MNDELVLFETHDAGVGVLTLNDPSRRNPVSDVAMVEAIVSALQRVSLDPELRVLIITGAGSAFSSGGDVRQMQA